MGGAKLDGGVGLAHELTTRVVEVSIGARLALRPGEGAHTWDGVALASGEGLRHLVGKGVEEVLHGVGGEVGGSTKGGLPPTPPKEG